MKEDGREQESERYVHLLSKAERQREQDVEARLCVKHSRAERVAVLPGWRVIHSTHYLCHLQGSERGLKSSLPHWERPAECDLSQLR